MGREMKDVVAFIDANRQRFVDELIEWVSIPSVSSDPARAPDVQRSAEHLAAHLRGLGAHRAEVWPTPGHCWIVRCPVALSVYRR